LVSNRKPGLLRRIIIRLIINAAAIYLTALVISGIHLSGWKAILLVAVLFGIVNTVIKPFVWIASCLLQLLTLGLFTLIINALMLYLTEWFADKLELNFTIDNFLSAFLGALLISAVSFILSKFIK
jgi:putative membrane protein